MARIERPACATVVQISASYEISMNGGAGTYEKINASAHEVIKIEEGASEADIQQSWAYIRQEVKYSVVLQIARAIEQRKQVIDSIFNSLPDAVRKQMEQQ